jgi:hypothetical protein
MFSQTLSPVVEPSMLYPSLANPRGQDYVCPKCNSTTRTSIISMLFSAKEISNLNKALGEWNDWVFKQGVVGDFKGKKKLEGYTLGCGWCGERWYVASELILNSIIVDQILNIHKFTDETKKEFGGMIIRNSRGICLDMIQIGEELAIIFEVTRPLDRDEEILGTVHCHPISDIPSFWDIATFLNNPWEIISSVIGAQGTLTVMIKDSETLSLPNQGLDVTVKQWQTESRPLEKLAEEFKFLLYKGNPDNLQLISGEEGTATLENLLRGIKGSKTI